MLKRKSKKSSTTPSKRFLVYISQVNQDCIAVEAGCKEEAVKKAKEIWLTETYPHVVGVEEEDAEQ